MERNLLDEPAIRQGDWKMDEEGVRISLSRRHRGLSGAGKELIRRGGLTTTQKGKSGLSRAGWNLVIQRMRHHFRRLLSCLVLTRFVRVLWSTCRNTPFLRLGHFPGAKALSDRAKKWAMRTCNLLKIKHYRFFRQLFKKFSSWIEFFTPTR